MYQSDLEPKILRLIEMDLSKGGTFAKHFGWIKTEIKILTGLPITDVLSENFTEENFQKSYFKRVLQPLYEIPISVSSEPQCLRPPFP